MCPILDWAKQGVRGLLLHTGKKMRFTSALLVLAYALHVQAWRFDIQSMFQSGPLAFLRRPSQDNQAAAEEFEPTTLLRHDAFRDRQIKLPNLPCILDNIQTIGACLCAEARDLPGLRFTRRDTAFCTSLLQLGPKLWRQECDVFTDSLGNVQLYRLVHVVFNTLAECNPERVEKETRIARRRLVSRGLSRIPPTYKSSSEPRVERPAIVTEVSTSDCTGEECKTSTTGEVRASAMQPQVIISGLRMYMEGLNGMGEDFTSGAAEVLTSPMSYVESRVRQRRGNSRFRPNRQGKVLGPLQVLRIVGDRLAIILVPVPSNTRSGYEKRNYRIECKIKNGMLLRAALTRKKLELMMHNWVEVELPLTAVKDDSYLDGTDRQRRQVRKGDMVSATDCRPRKGADGKLTFTCTCRRGGTRGNKNGNPGAAGTS